MPPPHSTDAERPATSLVLFDGGVPIAWIGRAHLGFGGFADERSAADGAWIAHAALSRWAQRKRGGSGVPRLPKHARLHVSDDPPEGVRWILADRLPIARLVDPSSVLPTHTTTTHATSAPAASLPRDGYAAFEIAVPLTADESEMRRAAYTAYRAICRAGLPFRLWSTGYSPPSVRDSAEGRRRRMGRSVSTNTRA
jgi:hypothetical protein